MKTCERIRETILTDYIDGELDKTSKEEIERHLDTCRECRSFCEEAVKTALPFSGSKRQAVPEGLWHSIRKGIAEEKKGFDPLRGLADIILSFPLRRLAPALAGAAVAFVIVTSVFYTQRMEQVKDMERSEYLASLMETPYGATDTGSNGLGTLVEEYFL